MKKINLWMLLCALFMSSAVLVSCDDEDEADLLQQDQALGEFMMRAAQSDMFEIQTGQLAQPNSTNANVESFGAMLVQDHTTSSNELKALAAKYNIALPTTLPADKQAIRDRLASEMGVTFDRDFAAAQVTAHQEAIALYEQADAQVTNTEVQAFIDKTLPVLRTHLQHAQTLQTQVNQAGGVTVTLP